MAYFLIGKDFTSQDDVLNVVQSFSLHFNGKVVSILAKSFILPLKNFLQCLGPDCFLINIIILRVRSFRLMSIRADAYSRPVARNLESRGTKWKVQIVICSCRRGASPWSHFFYLKTWENVKIYESTKK